MQLEPTRSYRQYFSLLHSVIYLLYFSMYPNSELF
nr:MAG TPA: hypothetical protein [Crassvirales sp.]